MVAHSCSCPRTANSKPVSADDGMLQRLAGQSRAQSSGSAQPCLASAIASMQLAGQNEAVQSLLTVPPDYLDSTKVGSCPECGSSPQMVDG